MTESVETEVLTPGSHALALSDQITPGYGLHGLHPTFYIIG